MKNIEDYLLRKLDHAKKRLDELEISHGKNPPEGLTYYDGQNFGYWQGITSTYENILDELRWK